MLYITVFTFLSMYATGMLSKKKQAHDSTEANLDQYTKDAIAKKKEESEAKKKKSWLYRFEMVIRSCLGDYITDKGIGAIDYAINKPNPLV